MWTPARLENFRVNPNRHATARWGQRRPTGRVALQSLCCITLAGLLCGCGRSSTDPAAPPSPPVNVSLVQSRRGDITRSITLPGTVAAYQAATLYAKIPGYLKRIAVDKGDTVGQGDFLAELDAPELTAELPKFQAELAVAEAEYKRDVEAQKKAPDLVVPATIDEAKGKVDVARANLQRVNDLLAYSRITAPFAGVITRRWADPGAFIPAATSGSSAANAAVVTLMDFTRVRVDVAVSEAEVPLITTSVPVSITVEELPGRSFTGNISRFEYALDPATRTMIAEIEMPNPKMELRPGMYAAVKIGIERRADALLAPLDAVVFEKAGASVFIVESGKAKKVPVQTGFNDGTNVEIVSGVKGDQPLILIGKRALNNGQAVTVTEAK
jgi:membrane fusion protein (multidrug efflux system)